MGGIIATLRHIWQRRDVRIAVGLVVVVVALWVVHHALGHFNWADVLVSLRAMSARTLLVALALTTGAYLLLSFYDVLALRYIGSKLPWRTAAFAAFSAYAVAHSVGFSALSGGSVRLRIYTRAGLSAMEIAQVVAFCTVTFALGACGLLGLSLLLEVRSASNLLHLNPLLVTAIGASALTLVAVYLLLNIWNTASFRIGGATLRFPGVMTALSQLLVAALDMAVAASVLYVLLPAGAAQGFFPFMGLYLLAQFTGLVSGVPGGLGVFESVLLLLLPAAPPHEMLASILAYRAIYYLLPFATALVVLLIHEVHWPRRKQK
jgi:uncharacterized membrane protein YbhN (UPF0104 family)